MKIRPPLHVAIYSIVFAAAISAHAEPVNLISNGDFSLTHPGTTLSGNQAIPDNWNNIQTQTTNATVLNGAMVFSTAHPTTNIGLYKDYIWQTFTVTEAGAYNVIFDYMLENAQNGKATNGAKIYVDQYYASAPGVTPVVLPNLVFQQTYADELMDFMGNPGGLNQWHLNERLTLDLSAGTHTLYLSSGTGDFINQYGARVWFDNVSIGLADSGSASGLAFTGPNDLPEPSLPGLLAVGAASLWYSRRRQVTSMA